MGNGGLITAIDLSHVMFINKQTKIALLPRAAHTYTIIRQLTFW